MLKNDYLYWYPKYKTTFVSKATRIHLRISDVCCSSSSQEDENVEKRVINEDRQHLINDICNILDLSYGTCWCNFCKICALSAELPLEMQVSFCVQAPARSGQKGQQCPFQGPQKWESS